MSTKGERKQRAKERRQCEGKVRYRGLIAAGQAADEMFQKRGALLRPYPCRFCGSWHIGH